MKSIIINNRTIGPGEPVYIIAEMSANHGQNLANALKIMEAAKNAGADAVKIQTYTPDTMTIDCQNENFIFKGQSLYDLFKEAHTPWEWYPELKSASEKLKIDLFSSPFDSTAVDFLEKMNVPAYKIASSEIIDIPLIRNVASRNKPVILSTGMATLEEIKAAVKAVNESGNDQVALLKCTATYPAKPDEINLKALPHLSQTLDIVTGLSDHTMGRDISVAAVAMGASVIERHLTVSRNVKSPDSEFSLEPDEFKEMVDAIRTVEKALGEVKYGPQGRESISKKYRRSLFIVEDMVQGDVINEKNVRSIRPSQGLKPDVFSEIIGRKVRENLKKGTALSWDLLE